MLKSKKHEDVFRIVVKGAWHGVRGRQAKYDSSVRKKIPVGEAFCGRKARLSPIEYAGRVTCGGCLSAMAATAAAEKRAEKRKR